MRKCKSSSKNPSMARIASVLLIQLALAGVCSGADQDESPRRNLRFALASSVERAPKCTSEQIKFTQRQLPGTQCVSPGPACSFSSETRCPQRTWLEQFHFNYWKTLADTMEHDAKAHAPHSMFIALCVGCQKGFGALEMLRMGSGNDNYTRDAWKQAIYDLPQTPVDSVDDCNVERQSYSLLPTHLKQYRPVQIHCIEPLKKSAEAVAAASKALKWSDAIVVSPVAIGKLNGQVHYPTAPMAGSEADIGLESCNTDNPHRADYDCAAVPIYTLDSYVQSFLQNIEQGKTIQAVTIQADAYDHDVLEGATITLQRTEYVEFQYGQKGSWESDGNTLRDTVNMLDSMDFTCYFAGEGNLWRLTGDRCFLGVYDNKYHSNVACVNRALAPQLLAVMERTFEDTIKIGRKFVPAFAKQYIGRDIHIKGELIWSKPNEGYTIPTIEPPNTDNLEPPVCELQPTEDKDGNPVAPVPVVLISQGRSGSHAIWEVLSVLTGVNTFPAEITGSVLIQTQAFFQKTPLNDNGNWALGPLCKEQEGHPKAGIAGFKWKPFPEGFFTEQSFAALRMMAKHNTNKPGERPQIKVIHNRRNVLDRVISVYKHSKDYAPPHCRKGDNDCLDFHKRAGKALKLPVEQLMEALQNEETAERAIDQALADLGVSFLTVNYDVLFFGDSEDKILAEWRRIFEFLGRGPTKDLTMDMVLKATTFASTSNPNHQEVIENFAEVSQALQGTDFQSLLH